MNISKIRLSYVSPVVKIHHLPTPLNLLVSASVQADIEDWEEGGEI